MNKTAFYQSKVNGLLVSGPNNLCSDVLCEQFDDLPGEGEPEPEEPEV